MQNVFEPYFHVLSFTDNTDITLGEVSSKGGFFYSDISRGYMVETTELRKSTGLDMIQV